MASEQSNKQEPYDIFAIDGKGRPTTYLSFRILKTIFREPSRWFTSKYIARLLVADYTDTDMICHQLELADFLNVKGSEPEQYRYNLNSRNIDVQVGFEKFLIEVELSSLPVHLMLDYSPSHSSRLRSYL